MGRIMWETADDLKAEIAEYLERMQKAYDALQALPRGFIDFKSHKKRETKRRELETELKHLKQIIIYAKEAMEDIH